MFSAHLLYNLRPWFCTVWEKKQALEVQSTGLNCFNWRKEKDFCLSSPRSLFSNLCQVLLPSPRQMSPGDWGLLNLHVFKAHLECSIRLERSWFSISGVLSRVYVFNKDPGASEADRQWITLWETLFSPNLLKGKEVLKKLNVVLRDKWRSGSSRKQGVLGHWWGQGERILTEKFYRIFFKYRILINNYELIWLDGAMMGIRKNGCWLIRIRRALKAKGKILQKDRGPRKWTVPKEVIPVTIKQTTPKSFWLNQKKQKN